MTHMATGLGSSIGQHFCAQGSRVAFVDIKVEEGNELARYIADQGHAKPEFIPCNLKDIPALQRVIRNSAGGRATSPC